MTQFAELVLLARSDTVRTATGDLDTMRTTGERTEKSVTQSTAKMSKGFSLTGKALQKMAVYATGAFTALASGATVIKAIGLQREFGSALAETSTLIDGNVSEMKLLEAASRDLAKTYGTSATQQAQAFYQAISAGAGDVAQSAELLDQANRLAIGGVTDVTTAVDILTTATNVYRAEGLLAADASDALFVAMRAGKTTIGELSSSLGKVLPLSQAVGLSFDETAAAVAALTKGGIATTEAVTGLRAILAAVNKPSSEARDLAKELGIEFNTAAIEAMGLAGFLEQVAEKTQGSNEAMALLFGGVEAIVPAMALAGQAGVYLNEILGDMATKAGATADAFSLMAEDDAQRLNRAMSEINDNLLTVGAAMLTMMVPAAEAFAGAMTGLSENTDVLMIALGTLAAYQIPALITGISSLVIWLGTMEAMFIAGAVAARGMAIAMNLIPFVAIVTGLTAIYRAYNESQAAAEGYKTSLEGLTGAQDDLNTATTRYYQDVTQANLTAMKTSAEAAVQATRDALEAAQRELKAASFTTNFFGASLYETERMKEAKAAIEELRIKLIEAEGRVDAAAHAQSNFNAMVREGKVAVEETGSAVAEVVSAYDGLLADLDKQIEMQMAIAQYGAESAEVARLQAEQERAIFQEKLNTLEMTNDQRDALMMVFGELQDVTAEAAAASANIGSGADEANRMAGNLNAAANALSAVASAASNMNISAIGIEAQNRALKAGNSLIAARTEGLIAAKRAELEPALGANAPDGMRAQAQRELEAYTEAVKRNSSAQEQNAALVKAAQEAASGGGSAGGSGGGGGGGVDEADQESVRRAERLMSDLERATLDAMTAQERYNIELADARELYEMGYLSADQYARAVDMIDQEFQDANFEIFKQGIEDISRSIADAILTGEDLGDSFGRVLQKMASDILSSGINDLLQGLFKPAGGGGGGFWAAIGGLFGLKSADGGGYTGDGPRSGGVDGKGGFPMIVHPQETITDHTKGGRVGASSGTQTVNVRIIGGDLTLTDDGTIMTRVHAEQAHNFDQYDRQLPRKVNNITRDPMRTR